MFTLLVFYLAAGLGLLGLALPLLLGKIGPNRFYGFRLSAALNNPAIWYAVNKYAAKRLVAAAASFLLAALGLYLVPGLSVDAYALSCLAVVVIVLGIGFWQSLRYMQRLERAGGSPQSARLNPPERRPLITPPDQTQPGP